MERPGTPQAGPLAGTADAVYFTAGLLVASLLQVREDAKRVAVVKGDLTPEQVAALPIGTHAAPDDGATVIALGTISSTRARLSGPGIGEPFIAAVPLGRPAIHARNRACANHPLGVDLLFVNADGHLTGLPRSTRVEVVE
ncbi:MAG TPA: phosphonate C-P lyase system protein PhnH [Candidatus Acidoferrales bacterium]|nr:phosphonate C-P lyase system protein PhnH [Candidatus Acidoferrales bacterium]